MANLKIYGTVRSRANRVIWMAEELGLAYESISVDLSAPRDPAFLAVNPNGRLPAIDDEGFHLFESMAINLYLAKKHGGPLAPRDLGEDAKMTQWSFWAVTELEKPGLDYLMHTMFLPPEKRDADVPPKAHEASIPKRSHVSKSSVRIGGIFPVRCGRYTRSIRCASPTSATPLPSTARSKARAFSTSAAAAAFCASRWRAWAQI